MMYRTMDSMMLGETGADVSIVTPASVVDTATLLGLPHHIR
jgi:hypothetical protein